MNQPDRYEKFVLPEGKSKIEFVKDDKVSNTATFILERETHTTGNLIRMQLLEDDHVVFAGYRQPHPLKYHIDIKVQTDGEETPAEALRDSVNELIEEVEELREQFQVHYDNYSRQRNNVRLAMTHAVESTDSQML